MKLHHLATALFITLSIPSAASAQGKFPPTAVEPQYRMTIASVRSATIGAKGTPVTPIENRTNMELDVTIDVKPSLPGAAVPTVPAWICVADRSGECDRYRKPVQPFPQLPAGTWHSVVTAAAPNAGNHARFRLNLCQGNQFADVGAPCGKVLAIAESDIFPVAASYTLHLKEVAIDQVRSPHNDTVFSTIAGDPHSNDASCDVRCTQAFLSTNSPNGTRITEGLHGVAGGRHIGPFVRVPGQDGDVWIAYVLLNLSARYDDDGARHRARTDALKLDALKYAKGGLTFRRESDYPAIELNSTNFRWAGCDGPLIGRVFTLPNARTADNIFTWTEATGQSELSFPDKDKSPDLFIAGDGCHQPRYRVTWRLVRDSWRR